MLPKILIVNLQNKSYYLPGDAVVYGTMNNNKVWEDGKFIRIFGHGTLSGDKLPHPSHAEPSIPSEDYWTYHPIDIQGRGFITQSTVELVIILNLT